MALFREPEVLVVGMVVLSLVGETPQATHSLDFHQDNPCLSLKADSVATFCSPRANESWASLGYSVRVFFKKQGRKLCINICMHIDFVHWTTKQS